MQPQLQLHRLGIALLAAGSLLLFSAPLTAGQENQPNFLIETITIDQANTVSSEILLAESRLSVGHSYTESQLRDAIHRLVRLPLVLDAKPHLRKGSAPGHYDLVIEVLETRRWFYGLDLDFTHWSDPVSVDRLDTTQNTRSTLLTVGRRFSVGRDGLFFLAVGGEEGALQAGYTHYDLFGRGGLLALSVGIGNCNDRLDLLSTGSGTGGGNSGDVFSGDARSVKVQDGCATTIFDLGLDPSYSSWSDFGQSLRARLQWIIPLHGNQSIRLAALRNSSQAGLRRRALTPSSTRFWLYGNLEEWRLDADWVLNSVDDPVFPSLGRIVEAGLEMHTLEADLTPIVIPLVNRPGQFEASARQMSLDFSAGQYWPLGQRGTGSITLGAKIGRSSIEDLPFETPPSAMAGPLPGGQSLVVNEDLDVVSATLTLGYSRFLRQTLSRRHWRQLRWENQLEAFYSATSPDLSERANPQRGFRLGTGLVYRTSWGLLRFNLNYLDVTGT